MKKLYFPFFLIILFLFSLFLSKNYFSSEKTPKSSFESSKKTLVENKIDTPTPTPTIANTKMILTGDIMLGRKLMIEAGKRDDPLYPFRNVKNILTSADITFVNLENPVIKNCPEHIGGFTFCTTPEIAKGLSFAGVDIVNLANNHSANYGKEGIKETTEILSGDGILSTGLGKLVIIERNNIKFGFIGFDFTVNEPTESNYLLVKNSDPMADVLVVAIHWGVEYKDTPAKFQKEWAIKFIKAGAELISGHHPHWVQGLSCISKTDFEERYIKAEGIYSDFCNSGEAPVYYSMGNFIFDQMWSEETKKGAMVELVFDGGNIVDQKVYKTYIRDWGQVELLN